VVIAIAMQGRAVRRIRPARAALLLLAAIALGGAITVYYMRFANRYVYTIEMPGADGKSQGKSYVIPLRPNAWLRQQVEGHGNWQTAIVRDAQVRDAIWQQNGSAVAALVTILACAQAMLVAAIVGGAWYLAAAAKTRVSRVP
jgi:hypothetical protein